MRKPRGPYKWTTSLEEYLLLRSKEVKSGCREWILSCDRYGYGQVSSPRLFKQYGKRRAHSLAYKCWKGDIPKGMCVMHSCDNRKCINVEHLLLGTFADNNKDMMLKGRNYFPKGEDNTQSKLNNEKVKLIKALKGVKTSKEVGNDFGVSYSTICHIWRGEKWSHV